MRYEDADYDGDTGSWLLSFVLGGLIGAAIALLVAPKSGRQTRAQIKDMAQDAKERAEGYYEQAKDRISTAMQKGAEVLQQKKEDIESTISRAKKGYQKAKETLTES